MEPCKVYTYAGRGIPLRAVRTGLHWGESDGVLTRPAFPGLIFGSVKEQEAPRGGHMASIPSRIPCWRVYVVLRGAIQNQIRAVLSAWLLYSRVCVRALGVRIASARAITVLDVTPLSANEASCNAPRNTRHLHTTLSPLPPPALCPPSPHPSPLLSSTPHLCFRCRAARHLPCPRTAEAPRTSLELVAYRCTPLPHALATGSFTYGPLVRGACSSRLA